MTSKWRETTKTVFGILAIGAIAGAGMRLAEWAIPKPESRVVICWANELDQVEICRSLQELKAKRAGKEVKA